MLIYISCLIIFLINLGYIYIKYIKKKEKKEYSTWYKISETKYITENQELLNTIFKKQGFNCNCWTNESINAYKNSDECGKEGLISFHKLVYHTKK